MFITDETVLRKNSIRYLTPFNSSGLTREISPKGRYRPENVRDRRSPTSGKGEHGTDRMLPVLPRVREFPYIGMERGVQQGLRSGTG